MAQNNDVIEKCVINMAQNDDIIEKCVGKFGKYQAVLLFLVLLGRFQGEFQVYNVVYILPKTDYICLDDNAYNMTNHCPCNNPQFDDSEILSSVVSEWNLICKRTSLASLSQSMIQVGFIPGSVLCGYLSDRFGRKIIVCLSVLFISIFVSLSTMVPEFWMFLVIRFLIGCGIGANASSVYVYAIELTGASFRTFTNSFALAMDVLSHICITFFAYFVREWKYLQLVGSVPWILTISYFWLLPESPRWQIAVGKIDEAVENLTKIAQRNGKCTTHIQGIVCEVNKSSKLKNSQQKSGSYLELLKTPRLRLYIIFVSLIWAICNLNYYGINQYIGRLQGSLYLNTLLSALFLIPTVPAVYFITYLDRKLGLPICFLTSSVSLFIFMMTPNDYRYFNLFIVILGFLGTYIGYAEVYLYTSEIFPTVVRNSAFGIASTVGRLGSFTAPFIVNIGVEWQTISVFLVLPIFATIMCMFLPETKGTVLKNTLEEFEIDTPEHSDINNK